MARFAIRKNFITQRTTTTIPMSSIDSYKKLNEIFKQPRIGKDNLEPRVPPRMWITKKSMIW